MNDLFAIWPILGKGIVCSLGLWYAFGGEIEREGVGGHNFL